MKRLPVKMLKRHCALLPGVKYNLPPGELLDFLLRKGIAVLLLPQPAADSQPMPIAAKRKKKVVRPSELKNQ